ncbi:MAG: DUF86 domain-containing protein [Cytophagia bacterium]|jgi:uncharacterized protein with HEPN domain|nr:MAG: DUF86 domain-containing protein [Cytophagia bacterium]
MQNDKVRLQHIREAIRKIEDFTKLENEDSFKKNELVQSAVERQLEIIGEAANHLTEEFKDKYPAMEWNKLRGFRNIIVHEYFGVSTQMVWSSVRQRIPQLKEVVIKILDNNEL